MRTLLNLRRRYLRGRCSFRTTGPPEAPSARNRKALVGGGAPTKMPIGLYSSDGSKLTTETKARSLRRSSLVHRSPAERQL